MMHPNPWRSYQKVATQTATPGQLVLMLYEGALRFLEQARVGFSEEDPLLFHRTISNNILKAQAILQELDVSLDLDQGGEFSENLRSLYSYLDRRLQESNSRKEIAGIEEVIARITVLRDAWREMLSKGSSPNQAVHLSSLSAAA